jgi:hypothetical protein
MNKKITYKMLLWSISIFPLMQCWVCANNLNRTSFCNMTKCNSWWLAIATFYCFFARTDVPLASTFAYIGTFFTRWFEILKHELLAK